MSTDVSNYKLSANLGSGSYGIVKRKSIFFFTSSSLTLILVGTCLRTGKSVACKLLNKDEIKGNQSIISKVKKEYAILSKC